MIDRPKFREIRYSPDVVIPEEYDYVEAKMDGIWGCMVIESGYYRIYSRTGKIKQAGELDKDSDIIDKLTNIIMEAVANLELENKKAADEDMAENEVEIKEAID